MSDSQLTHPPKGSRKGGRLRTYLGHRRGGAKAEVKLRHFTTPNFTSPSFTFPAPTPQSPNLQGLLMFSSANGIRGKSSFTNPTTADTMEAEYRKAVVLSAEGFGGC
ncbi:Hypothetical protein NTJ_12436 [Nesidiocoris tenuis]|uniref:Uncharacterized protein n=1 Tax=Nesidiocoris tenuis TaxID=355587 RepID=A0ABN7B6Z2_9HEMI|nr:Hypothetical protein NTJ_12436 [Nesidiocoris tenuis]